jgi:uncharacterized membrane protein
VPRGDLPAGAGLPIIGGMAAAAHETSTDAIPFAAVLRPHRSLGRRGIAVALVPVAVIGGIGALVFALAGAWPVSGFLGLDIVLLYGALRLSLNAAARQEERIELDAAELVVRCRSGKRRAEFRFNPYWVRLHHETEVEGRSRLVLASHGRRLVIGRFLSQPEREALWRRLDAALAAHRRTGAVL